MENVEKWHKWLEQKMKEHNITQVKLAEVAGISKQHMNNIIRQKRNITINISKPIEDYIKERENNQ